MNKLRKFGLAQRHLRRARGCWMMSVIVLSAASSARAQYSEVNSASPLNWNAAPWSAGEPNGGNNLIGLTRGGGTMTIDTPEVAGGLLVGWLGSYNVVMNTGGSLTLGGGSVAVDSLLLISENGSGQGTFTQNAGTVATSGVRFNRGGAADNGAYHLNGGVLSTTFVSSDKGTATFNFNGGTLRATTNSTTWFGANITANVQAGGAIIDTQAFNATMNASLLNAGGGLTKQGTGTLILAANNTYAGLTTISSGTLQLGNGGATGDVGSSNVFIDAAGNLTINRNNSLTIAGNISGGGSLTQSGSGTTTLTGALSYSGLTSVSGGALQIGNNNASASVGASSFALSNGANLIFSRNAINSLFTTQSISGTGNVIFRGQLGGYFTFRNGQYTGTMDYNGTTIVNLDDNTSNDWFMGALWLETDGVHSANAALDLQSGKIYLRASTGVGQTFKGINGAAGTFITSDTGGGQKVVTDVATAQTFTFNGVIGADGTGVGGDGLAVIKNGAGTQIFTGANTYNGGTTINGGVLQIGNGGATGEIGAGNINITSPGNLTINRNNTFTITSGISGSGTFTQAGSGTTVITNPSYSGNTNITNGALQIGNNNASTNLGASSFMLSNGADLIFYRNNDNTEFTTQSITGTGDVIFRGQQGGYYTFRGAYTGTMSYTGTTIVDLDAGNLGYRGALWLEKDNVHSPNASLDLQAGKVFLRNSNVTGQTFKGLSGNAGTFITTDSGGQRVNLDVATAQTFTFAGVIGSDGSFGNDGVIVTKLGAGTQVFTGANTYNGGTTISNGTLQIGNGGATGSLGSGNIVITSPGNLTINRNNAFSITAGISGSGTFTQAGSGTTTITGDPVYIGQTNITNGALQIGSNNASVNLGASSYVLSNGADLIFSRNNDNTEFSTQSISGTGDLIFRGQQTGYFTFRNAYSGVMSHSGTTVVDLNDASGNQWYQGSLWLEKDNVHSPNAAMVLQSGKIYMRNSGGTGQTFAGLSGNAGTFITTDQGLQKVNINTLGSQLHVFAGTIGGDGTGNNNVAVTKLGTGTQVFSGANTYNGVTNVAAGVLAIDGTHTGAGSYTVQSGATLGGDGVITFAAGNSMWVSGNPGRLSPGNTTDPTYLGTDRTYSQGTDVRTVGTLTLNASSPAAMALDLDGILQLDIVSPLQHDLLNIASGFVSIDSNPVTGAVLEINGQQSLAGIDFGTIGIANGVRVDLLVASAINGNFRNIASNSFFTDAAGRQMFFGNNGTTMFLQSIVPEPGSVILWSIVGGCILLLTWCRRCIVKIEHT